MAQQQAAAVPPETVKVQAGKLLGAAAGYVAARTIEMGHRHGLFERIAKRPGLTSEQLAKEARLDPFYTGVWCRSAFAAEVLDAADGGYRLAPAMEALLVNPDSPGYMMGMFTTLDQPEVFDRFAENLPTGARTWWDQCSPAFIRGVSESGRAGYTRLAATGLDQVPGLNAKLAAGGRLLELACGSGVGLVKLAAKYPQARFLGVDGDAYSLQLAAENVKAARLQGRVDLVTSTLEDFAREGEFDAALINISMHECRDIERVAENVRRALKPGGVFVISDFPFPTSPEALRTPAGRVMEGIQFFEALIGDQLLPTKAFVELLQRHGFRGVAAFDITPLHAVTHGEA